MYSTESFKVAEKLVKDSESRDEMIRQLMKLRHPITYSNQDFDRKQALASLIFDLSK